MAAVLLLTGALAPSPANAWHPRVPAFLWEKYYSTVPPASRDVGWLACATTDYEENITSIGFNVWKNTFGNSIKHTKYPDSCGQLDKNMRLWARSAGDTHTDCQNQNAVACFKPVDWVVDGLGNLRIRKSYLEFDWAYFDGLWDAQKQMHIMEHEFGHGMSLGDPHSCGESVMSYAGCTDAVHGGTVYPNDVCFPDYYLGYGQARCQTFPPWPWEPSEVP